MKLKLSHLIITVLAALLPLALPAQNRIVSGTVKDQGGEPLVGAGVLVQGSATRGAVTDVDGRFQISAAPTENLVVSFIGYEDAVVSAAQTTLSIVLRSDSNFLEETVVVGYGVQKKATLTGAVSAVTNKDIVVTKNENVVNMLSGKVAGLRISQRSSRSRVRSTTRSISAAWARRCSWWTAFRATRATSPAWTPMKSSRCPS